MSNEEEKVSGFSVKNELREKANICPLLGACRREECMWYIFPYTSSTQTKQTRDRWLELFRKHGNCALTELANIGG